ncbi:MAG: hypothetical protein GF329_04355 [Candidatus Lokiarchaeota archaeon]|nr:hypothetical protein [Candidatus Lokiarchaeota archaeon]
MFPTKNKNKLSIALVFALFIFLISANLVSLNYQKANLYTGDNINSQLSSNPSNPTILADDSYDIETSYSAGFNYYYETYLMLSSDYHLIWLTCTSPGNDFDLYLYDNSDYSSLIVSSTSSSDFDWVVYLPTSSEYTYPRVYAYDDGQGIIEAESGFDGTIGSPYSVCSTTDEFGDIYEFNLDSSKTYIASLTVPTDSDLDLYCYYLSDGESGDSNDYEVSSTSGATGVDEQITFSPTTSGFYAFVIIRKSGGGSGVLSIIRERQMIPGFELIQVIFGIVSLISISLVFYKKSKSKIFKI